MPLHELDYCAIDELDEVSGDEQYVLIWCETHQKHEWHWIDRSLIGMRTASLPKIGIPSRKYGREK